MESSRPKDVKIPLILLGIGVVIYVIVAAMIAESSGPLMGTGESVGMGTLLLGMFLGTVLQVVLGIIALFITAAIMGIDFGPLGLAILKLAAIMVFPDAVAAVFPIPLLGWIISMGLYLWLLAWLFDLEPLDTVVCAFVIFFVNIGAGILLATLFVGLA